MSTTPKGFTLIELMITIAIAAILITAGAPSLRTFYSEIRANNTISQISNLFVFARNQAISYGVTVSVCPYAAIPCGDDWRQGISVYSDDGSNTNVLKIMPGFDTQDMIAVSGPANNQINFTSDGLASVTTSIVYCPNGESQYSKSITIGTAGLVKAGIDGQSCN